MKRSFKNKLGLLLGPLFFLLILSLDINNLSWEGKAVLATTVWVALWWITEAIPIEVTSLLPVVLLPITGGLALKLTTTSYYSPLVMLFMGGFIIALAIEKWNLHQRIALTLIAFLGTNPRQIVLGFMVATGFLSMWISNTATALMMLPIGLAIAGRIDGSDNSSLLGRTLMFGIAYAASIGGMATLIGTPTNPIFSAVVSEMYGLEVSFFDWFIFGFPLSVILLFCAWLYLTSRKIKDHPKGQTEDLKKEIKQQLSQLGPMKYEEKMVAVVFATTAFLWISRSFLLELILPSINDTSIAMLGAIVLFMIPSKNQTGYLLDWSTAKNLPWGILLLFGAGISLATGFQSSGLASWFGSLLTSVEILPLFLLILVVILIVNFFTEITSNVATASVLLPILGALSASLSIHPFGLMVAACLASSCAFMLPVATPPNAIVFSSGYIRMENMVRTGLFMNLLSAFLIFLMIYFVMPILWQIELDEFPF